MIKEFIIAKRTFLSTTNCNCFQLNFLIPTLVGSTKSHFLVSFLTVRFLVRIVAVSKLLKESGFFFFYIEMIAFTHLFLFPETISWLGLCNHLGDTRATEGEMLLEYSLTTIIVSKASV